MSKKQDYKRLITDDDMSVLPSDTSAARYKQNKRKQRIEKVESLVGKEFNKLKTVHNAVAVIEFDGRSHRFAEPSVNELILSILAFLVSNGLLYSKRCIFFTDGAKNLKSAIERVFGFLKPTIILDWYHVTV